MNRAQKDKLYMVFCFFGMIVITIVAAFYLTRQ